jgi:hypothetical protein
MKRSTERHSAGAQHWVRTWLSCLVIAAPMGTAHADIVTDWNEKLMSVMDAEKVGGGYPPSRIASIVHIAMFDAVNAVETRYASYAPVPPETTGASAAAAAHAAARRVLSELYPRHKATLDAAFDTGVASVPDGAARLAGIAVGETAALALIGMRLNDGASGPNAYRPLTAPGVYVATALPLMSHVAGIKPFALRSVSQFRPGPPPALDSSTWARDYNESMELGEAKSQKRTDRQTETAKFWQISGSAAWNQAARGLVTSKPLPLVDSARLFAQLNMSMHDALLAVFDAKFEYGLWRPITAIRNGDRDGNDATTRNAGWTPLIDTPMHPEYPCAHCVAAGASGAVLESAFGSGPQVEFTLTYAAMPGVTRKYTTIQQLVDEINMARICGGVHFRTSTEVGHALGVKVGEYVLQNHMQSRR